MFLLVKNVGWARTSLWDLYFVENEDIKSKYSSVGLLIHEALEYMKLKKKKTSELTYIFSLLMLYVVFEARVYFKYHIYIYIYIYIYLIPHTFTVV